VATNYKVLILGASYGSLLGSKLLMAGHHVTLVCRDKTAALINQEGTRVRMPVKGRAAMVEIDSRQLAGTLDAKSPAQVEVADYDLVCLAMQEPQYSDPEVRQLMQSIAKAKIPCMSIMNMPPLPYLARIAGIDPHACRPSFLDPDLWDAFVPGLMTLCSPDPQAFRPPEEPANVLQVGLPTNFKVARFDDAAHNALLQRLQDDIGAARLVVDGESLDLPVKLKFHESLFVPLAKWSMLMTGNYRCVLEESVQPIERAVHGDVAQSWEVYTWVTALCELLGAAPEDMVPFEKYAAAAQGLLKPSSAARSLAGGATHIERIDLLIQLVAAQHGLHSEAVDQTVTRIDGWLNRNRSLGRIAA